MQVTPLNKMGSNMVKVFGRLKKQLDPEPVLERNGYPSEDWVQWYMRQMDCARVVAVNVGYKKLDCEKRLANFPALTTFAKNDAALLVLGVTRIQDYYFTGGALVRRIMSSPQ